MPPMPADISRGSGSEQLQTKQRRLDVSLVSVLVTGGAGYIGAHTCKALRAAGYTPIAFDNFSTGHKDFVRWGPLVHGDIRDTGTLVQALCSHDVAAVLHFAASAVVGDSVEKPMNYYENNVEGSLSLLRAMSDTGCRRLVFSSSCAVYGEPDSSPIPETTSLQPVNPYGSSKAMVERILSDCSKADSLQYIALRYFNAAGADPESELGELRELETHLIPRAMMAIQGYITDFAVFGLDYPTPDGTAVRDYTHVTDLADAHVIALQRLLAGVGGGTFNLGTGRGYSVRQILDAISAETGRQLIVSDAPRREGDPAILIADTGLSRTKLCWEPRGSDLSTIVRTAWAWHRHAHPLRDNARETNTRKSAGATP